MLNHINVIGRLTRDPELRTTNSGMNVATFSIACDRDRSSNGEKQTDFFNVTAWGKTAEFVSRYFSKGRLIVISGRLQTRQYDDKDGNKRTATEIIAESVYFGDSKQNDESGQAKAEPTYAPSRESFQKARSVSSAFSELSDEDGDLPF